MGMIEDLVNVNFSPKNIFFKQEGYKKWKQAETAGMKELSDSRAWCMGPRLSCFILLQTYSNNNQVERVTAKQDKI